MIFRTSSAHEESNALFGGDIRDFSVNTKSFTGENGVVKKLHGVRLEWVPVAAGRPKMEEVPGSDFELPLRPVPPGDGLCQPRASGPDPATRTEIDQRGNVQVNDAYMTSVPGVFAAGDMRRGQSLVVWAISEGRRRPRRGPVPYGTIGTALSQTVLIRQ